MADKKLGLSLKYKLILLLTLIPVASLAVYILLATRLFENDKIAYVKDSSVAVAKSLSVQFRLEANSFVDKIKPIIENFDPVEKSFNEAAQELFDRQDRMDAVVVIHQRPDGMYEKAGELVRDNDFGRSYVNDSAFLSRFQLQALQSNLAVTAYGSSDIHLALGTVLGDKSRVGHYVVMGLYRASELYGAFSKVKMYHQYLVDGSGRIQLGPDEAAVSPEALSAIQASGLPEGAIDVPGDKPLIASYAYTSVNDMVVLAIIDRQEALTAVNALLIQSLLFFVALISTTVIISVFASVKLTSALSELYEATKQIAKGQFDVRVRSTSNDEVGGLAEGFNFMAGEVSRLMKETKEKARMEGELETVKVVQETLFPATESKFGSYHIVGHFESASECGGDWWNYSEVGDKIFLWIGDATGHGAPAAMVTSAAKAAATIIEDLPFITPGKALEVMNKAIHETAKSRILMTFFLAAIDKKTGEMAYANASHESPFLIRARADGKPITKKDLEPLVEASGPRLGDKRSSKYNEAKVQLRKGDAIVFYTDGIIDVKSPAGKIWGERGFVKSICASANKRAANEKIAELRTQISDFRQGTELVDDVTLFMCQYGEAA